MYSCSPTSSQISLKNSLGKKVFQILAKIEMTQNKKKIAYLAAIMKRYNIFKFFFFAELWFFIVHTYMMQISLQNSAGKVVFYGWVPRNPPWAPTGVKVPWSLKGSRMGRSDKVSLWCVALLINTRFLFFILE